MYKLFTNATDQFMMSGVEFFNFILTEENPLYFAYINIYIIQFLLQNFFGKSFIMPKSHDFNHVKFFNIYFSCRE